MFKGTSLIKLVKVSLGDGPEVVEESAVTWRETVKVSKDGFFKWVQLISGDSLNLVGP